MRHEMDKHMKLENLLEAVKNDRVEFVTMRPSGSPFATLERRVVVTAPPELVELSRSGDVQVLDELVELLQDPDRAWAAEVLLAAMTGIEEKMVDSFAASPDQWWSSLGKGAHERWAKWLSEEKEDLVWNAEEGVFVEKE